MGSHKIRISEDYDERKGYDESRLFAVKAGLYERIEDADLKRDALEFKKYANHGEDAFRNANYAETVRIKSPALKKLKVINQKGFEKREALQDKLEKMITKRREQRFYKKTGYRRPGDLVDLNNKRGLAGDVRYLINLENERIRKEEEEKRKEEEEMQKLLAAENPNE